MHCLCLQPFHFLIAQPPVVLTAWCVGNTSDNHSVGNGDGNIVFSDPRVRNVSFSYCCVYSLFYWLGWWCPRHASPYQSLCPRIDTFADVQFSYLFNHFTITEFSYLFIPLRICVHLHTQVQLLGRRRTACGGCADSTALRKEKVTLCNLHAPAQNPLLDCSTTCKKLPDVQSCPVCVWNESFIINSHYNFITLNQINKIALVAS